MRRIWCFWLKHKAICRPCYKTVQIILHSCLANYILAYVFLWVCYLIHVNIDCVWTKRKFIYKRFWLCSLPAAYINHFLILYIVHEFACVIWTRRKALMTIVLWNETWCWNHTMIGMPSNHLSNCILHSKKYYVQVSIKRCLVWLHFQLRP